MRMIKEKYYQLFSLYVHSYR